MPVRVPSDVFRKVVDGYIAYWIEDGRHRIAYIDEDGNLQVLEAGSLEELEKILEGVDYVEAKGLCIFGDYNDPDSTTECIRSGFKGREIIALLRGP